MIMKKVNFLALLALLSLLYSCGGGKPADNRSAEVVLHTTAGDIRLLLDGRTPIHRDNFLKLTREGFFDSLLFHRVIEGFMVQAGDPDSRRAAAGAALGEGDAGYLLPAEILYPALAHTRGALAAARTPDSVNPKRKSSSSQFYIVWGSQYSDATLDKIEQYFSESGSPAPEIPDSLRALYRTLGGTPHLDGKYTVFGRVVSGLNIVGSIQMTATDERDRPLEDIRILSAEVIETSQQ